MVTCQQDKTLYPYCSLQPIHKVALRMDFAPPEILPPIKTLGIAIAKTCLASQHYTDLPENINFFYKEDNEVSIQSYPSPGSTNANSDNNQTLETSTETRSTTHEMYDNSTPFPRSLTIFALRADGWDPVHLHGADSYVGIPKFIKTQLPSSIHPLLLSERFICKLEEKVRPVLVFLVPLLHIVDAQLLLEEPSLASFISEVITLYGKVCAYN